MTTTTRRGIIIIPRAYTPNWDITVGGVNVDEDLTEISINRPVTEGTGNFSMTLINPANKHKFAGMEELIVNADFSGGTTRIFRGTVEEVKRKLGDNPTITVSGRHISGELADLTVTEVFNSIELSQMVRNIITTYAPNYTATDVTATTITDSIAFDHTPFYEALREIAYRANYDLYVDDDRDFNFFASGSITNNSEAIGPTYFQSSDGLGDSVVEIKNRVIVYGSTGSGLPIIYTTNDSASQALYGVREKFINDSRVNTVAIANMLGRAFLDFNKSKTQIGTVNSLGLPTLLPGDKIYIIQHEAGISGQFRISHINDKIGDNGWFTNVTVERTGSVRFASIFRDIARTGATADFKNPNKMKYSVVDDFDNQNQIETNTSMTITNSEARQTTLGTNGRIITITTTAPEDVSIAELRVAGQDLGGSTFEISVNDGVSYTNLVINDIVNISPVGKLIKLRITLIDNSTNVLPTLRGISLLYR